MADGNILIPSPVFPVAIDSDYTLFLTYDSTQSCLSEDLAQEDLEINIYPAVENEVFPDNGFVTIGKELIYYDSVEKYNGKVCRLINCIRGIEGEIKPVYIKQTPVYGMVVAQQQNQLIEAILAIENTIGDIVDVQDFSDTRNIPNELRLKGTHLEETLTLQTSIKSLLSCAPSDDDSCPQVDFIFNTFSTTPITAEYCIRIQGSYQSYQLDFGDGSSVTDLFEGTHTYTSGPVDPVLTVINDACTLVLTPETPREGCDIDPVVGPAVSFHVPIPSVTDFPSFIYPQRVCTGPLNNLPPIAVPGLDLASLCSCISAIAVNNPSIISCIGCNFPSTISVIGCNFPSVISAIGCNFPSVISMTGCCNIPSVIRFKGSIPSVLEVSVVGNAIPTQISIVGTSCIPSIISFSSPLPNIPSTIRIKGTPIPSTISLIGCNLPSVISIVGCCTFPSTIRIKGSFPSTISLVGSFPSSISLIDSLPSSISLIGCNFPSTIRVKSSIPSVINVSCCNIPSVISIVGNINLPSVIRVKGSLPSVITVSCCEMPSVISVVNSNVPSLISVVGNIPSTISIIGCDIQSVISVINTVPNEIIVRSSIPSVISVQCCDVPIPSEIKFKDCCYIPSEIAFGPAPSITFESPPLVSVDWGVPPVISVICGATSSPMAMRGMADTAGIPITISELLPKEIKILAPNLKLSHNLPEYIPVKSINVPSEILVRNIDIPKEINIKSDLPKELFLRLAPDFSIVIPDIKVTGIPSYIELIGPSSIQLILPENTVVPLKYEGPPSFELILDKDSKELLRNIAIPSPKI